MKYFWILPAVLLLFYKISFGQPQTALHEVRGLKHAGGIHFYPSPGILELSIFKEDEKKGNAINQVMHAVILGPDGSSLDSVKLYGTVERNMQIPIKEAGVYTLHLSMNNDQNIRSVTWGFRTNAQLFMINSSAGHTDRRRVEPIILDGGKRPFGVYFKPKKGKFHISVDDLPDEIEKLHLFGGSENLIKELSVKNNQVSDTLLSQSSDEVWELRLPESKGTINIEGVTYGWEDQVKPLPVWTSSRQSYFNLEYYHWLLSPRRFARDVKRGDEGEIEFSIYNNSDNIMPLEILIKDAPDIGNFEISTNEILLLPKTSSKISVKYTIDKGVSEGSYPFQVLVKNLDSKKQAFSLIELRVDNHKNVELPIQLKLFEHDQFQFAYEPDYPRDNQFYFDSENRPWLVSPEGLKVKIRDHWQTISLNVDEEDIVYPTSTIGTDAHKNVYTVVNIKNIPYLVQVNGNNLKVVLIPLPAGGTYKMETYMGGKVSEYPPAILRFVRDTSKKRVSRWARVHRLELLSVTLIEGKLKIEDPVLISDNCVGSGDHSGITNAIAAEGEKLHIIWGETSEPGKGDPGVPTYTISYDRKTKSLSSPDFLAYSPPVNDVHNMSSILIDSEGTKHVIIGAHGRPFQYLKQLKDQNTWSKPISISELGQTYVGAVLDAKDGIHLFCRTWRNGKAYPGIFDASLFFQRTRGSSHIWEEQQPFALPALPGYTVYYHRLTVDRHGKLYLSMDYWPTWSVYRESYRDSAERTSKGTNRVIFTSGDGKQWDLLRTFK